MTLMARERQLVNPESTNLFLSNSSLNMHSMFLGVRWGKKQYDFGNNKSF